MKLILTIIFLITNLFSMHLFTPIPSNIVYDKNKALLGKKLFNEVKLSHNNNISCATCHYLTQGGDDNVRGATANNGKIIPRNSPTVYNAVYNETQHWDGSMKNLYEQAINSITHPLAMNSNFKEIISKLEKDKNYKKDFKTVYNSTITKERILDAIIEFEKVLITPNSRFDQYLEGKNSLSTDEIKGYNSFREYGCVSCHNGINIGGNLIQKIGVLKKYKTKDFGKYGYTKIEDDMYYFKVPTLRNIELTAPYFHDGKVKTLKKAVENMIEFQIGYTLTNTEIDNIVKFLKTLTGDIPNIVKDKNE